MVKTRFNSIFGKLLVIMVVAAFAVNLLLAAFFSHIVKAFTKEPFHKNAAQYVNYLMADLGSPPDYDRALAISHDTSLTIQYHAPGISWSTSPLKWPLTNVKLEPYKERPDIKFGRWRRHHFIQVDRGEERFIFELGGAERQVNFLKKCAVFFVLMMMLVLFAVYLVIRRILNPISALADGVREVGAGNLEYAVNIRSMDELGDLAAAFNNMTRQVRVMLHSKERLLLDVSHELRSPITRMKLSVEMLAESHIRKAIKEDVSEIENMVTEILESARLRSPGGGLNLIATDLVVLITSIINEYKELSSDIHWAPLSGEQIIMADPDKIRIVLKNIINNAVKYSAESMEAIVVELSSHTGNVMVQISDNGVGIDKKDLPHIFEPFYRTDTSRSKRTGGYGLGLSLCKSIMEAHGGKILVDSSLEKGTRLTLVFPKPDLEKGQE